MSWVRLVFQNMRLGSIIRVQLEARTKISTRLRYLLKTKIDGVREQIDVVFAPASSHPNWNSEELWKKKKTKELLRSSFNIKNWLRIRRKKTEKESKGDKRCCQRQSRKGVHRPRRHEQTPCSLSTSVESSRFFLTIDLTCFNSFLAFNDQLTCYKDWSFSLIVIVSSMLRGI